MSASVPVPAQWRSWRPGQCRSRLEQQRAHVEALGYAVDGHRPLERRVGVLAEGAWAFWVRLRDEGLEASAQGVEERRCWSDNSVQVALQGD